MGTLREKSMNGPILGFGILVALASLRKNSCSCRSSLLKNLCSVDLILARVSSPNSNAVKPCWHIHSCTTNTVSPPNPLLHASHPDIPLLRMATNNATICPANKQQITMGNITLKKLSSIRTYTWTQMNFLQSLISPSPLVTAVFLNRNLQSFT